MLTGLFCFDPFFPFGNPWGGLLREIEFPDLTNLEAMVNIVGFDSILNFNLFCNDNACLRIFAWSATFPANLS